MALKQDFTKQVESQLAVWQGQIKDYQERLAQAGRAGQGRLREGPGTAQDECRRGRQAARPGARSQRGRLEGHAGGLGQGLAQLQQGWAEALKRFQ